MSFKVDAHAKVQGSEEQEKYPIDAKVKGVGKDGALSVQIFGSDPIAAKISGDSQSPIAVAPIKVDAITVAPDLKSAAETLNFAEIVNAMIKLSEGIKVEVSNPKAPLSITLGKIPVDLVVSVSSPVQETVFKVEIKGSVGGN